jgi:lipopolysaccharide transport system permease protein
MVRQHLHLLNQLVRHEIGARYKGSLLGLLWMLINPLVMLAIYGFVFSVVFSARWPGLVDADQRGFVLVLFAGLIVFTFASEVWTRAPGLFRENPSFVRKVIFPLYLLPITSLALPLIQATVSACILFVCYLLLLGTPPVSAILLPLASLFYIGMVLGVSYFIAALGAFIPDLRHVIGTMMTVLLFVSPVFYPLGAVPPAVQPLLTVSPLTPFLEITRALLFDGGSLDGSLCFHGVSIALLCLLGGVWFFHKVREGFSDVV